jgi:hypothetical protein
VSVSVSVSVSAGRERVCSCKGESFPGIDVASRPWVGRYQRVNRFPGPLTRWRVHVFERLAASNWNWVSWVSWVCLPDELGLLAGWGRR